MQTSATMPYSAGRMRSRNSSPSSSTVKAGKLAKPRVATATLPTFTARKKVSQCAHSSSPLPNSSAAWRRLGRDWRERWPAKPPRASAPNSARPKTITSGPARISLPKMPESPNISAPMCRPIRAERGVM
ncbi:hypothetical protein D9M73_251870 [compost metagenome]